RRISLRPTLTRRPLCPLSRQSARSFRFLPDGSLFLYTEQSIVFPVAFHHSGNNYIGGVAADERSAGMETQGATHAAHPENTGPLSFELGPHRNDGQCSRRRRRVGA